jgi:Mg-chelatase subunit ChlD
VASQMNTSRILVVGCAALLLWTGAPSSAASPAQQLQLRPVGPVQMLQREPGDPTPFFRLELTIVDERQSPIAVDWPWPKHQRGLKKAIEINAKGHGTVRPFYVESPKATAKPEPIVRETMLVVDISGSMTDRLADGRTKFEAAKEAINRFLHNLQEGVDHIAIVPFESRHVVARIKAGRFVNTKAEAIQQMEELPRPRGHTALYSAAMAALEVLESRKASRPWRKFRLIVLTDGQNDVRSGGDPGLLDGPRGLDAVVSKASQVKIPIYAVGFGKPRDLDEESLRAMAWPSASNYYPAPDPAQLERVLEELKVVRRALLNRLRITFATDHREWSTLKGLTFNVRFKRPDGRWIESVEIRWFCQPMTACPPEGTLTEAEIRALLDQDPIGSGKTFQGILIRRLGILALFSGGLVALWFIPGRLLWTWPRISRPFTPLGVHSGRPRLSTSPGKPTPMVRPRPPGQDGQSPPSNLG